MQSLVIYDSRFGNTEKIAQAIGRGVGRLGAVQVMSTTDALRATGAGGRPDLLLVGGPTHNRGPSADLQAFIKRLPTDLGGVPAACFDTRYRGPVLLMGSAAMAAAKALARAGFETIAPPASFFVARRGPMEAQALEAGEVERAEAWGSAVAAAYEGRQAGRPAAVAG